LLLLFLLLLLLGVRRGITPDTSTENVLPEATRRGKECGAPEHVDAETKKRIQSINRNAREIEKLERNLTLSDSRLSSAKKYDQ
jgi:hypothetical protein